MSHRNAPASADLIVLAFIVAFLVAFLVGLAIVAMQGISTEPDHAAIAALESMQ